jgi:hypothetical protein
MTAEQSPAPDEARGQPVDAAARRHSLLAAAARTVLAVAGLGMLGVGAAAALTGAGAAVVATPIIAGALLLVSPFVLDRIETLSLSATNVHLQLTRTVSELGAPRTARILEDTDLARFADSYGFIHNTLAAPQYKHAKVHLQDTLLARAAEIAMTNSLDVGEVRRVFLEGPPVVRALALGLMEGDESLADADTVISAVTRSRSANEQFHGLRLAARIWHRVDREKREELLAYLRTDPRIGVDTDRARLADELRRRAGEQLSP